MAIDIRLPILIVDDYASMRRIMRTLLIRLGFDQLDEAADASEALVMLRRKPYGLIISDWNMEPVSGYDLLKQVRGDRALAKIPFMLVTASEKAEFAASARSAGADAYLVKPFSEAVLMRTIESVMGAKAA